MESLVTAMVRGAFEYQGQKCSAASRAYIPQSLWPQVRERLVADVASIRMGDVGDFRTFMGAVIDQAAFDTIKGFIDRAKKAKGKAKHPGRRRLRCFDRLLHRTDGDRSPGPAVRDRWSKRSSDRC